MRIACILQILSFLWGVVWSMGKLYVNGVNRNHSQLDDAAWLMFHCSETFVFLYFVGFLNRQFESEVEIVMEDENYNDLNDDEEYQRKLDR